MINQPVHHKVSKSKNGETVEIEQLNSRKTVEQMFYQFLCSE